MKVVRLNSNVPLRAIPEAELNRIIVDEFTGWIANLLSLTDEVSGKRLAAALPAVKEHCWSMGFAEIKKMLEMYADNRLSIKPKSNYFDRVLFGQIVEAYKSQKKPSKASYEPRELTNKEKDLLVYSGLVNCYDAWYQDKRISPGYSWVYDHVVELGILTPSKEQKMESMEQAKHRIKQKRSALEKATEEIDKTPAIISEAKKILLENYFSSITKEQFINAIN